MFKNHCDCLKKPVKEVSPQNHHVQKKSNRNYMSLELQDGPELTQHVATAAGGILARPVKLILAHPVEV